MSEAVEVWTDGACSGNPGPGGWGAILSYKGKERELSGGEALTTNNRMELMAAIAALETLTRPCTVALHTDSQYLRQGITGWIMAGRRTAGRPPTASRSRTRNSGSASMPRSAATRSSGNGSRAMPATP